MKVPKPICTLLVLGACAACADGALLVVPNGAENQEGNDGTIIPFLIGIGGSERYQQVYHASQFSTVDSGAFITDIFFRPDCFRNNGGTWITNLLVRLSITPKGPDELSTVFSQNIGANDILVFGPGEFFAGGSGGGTNNCPKGLFTGLSTDRIILDNPFFYNPADGNLLLDVSVNGIIQYVNDGGIQLDAVNVVGDSVSRVYAAPSSATTATTMDTYGLVTGFQFLPVPSLTSSLTTNAVVISWPAWPKNFVLQWTDQVNTNTTWQLYTNQIGGGAVIRVLTLPRNSLDQVRFFRLACPSCPPISQPGVSGNGNPAARSQRIP